MYLCEHVCVLTSVRVYLCEHMCVCVPACSLCYHVWNAGSPGVEDVGEVFNWPSCESYILFLFICLLLQISFYMSATQAPLEEMKMSVK